MIYEFRCRACGSVMSVERKFGDNSLPEKCSSCKASKDFLSQKPPTPAVVFKGDGWGRRA